MIISRILASLVLLLSACCYSQSENFEMKVLSSTDLFNQKQDIPADGDHQPQILLAPIESPGWLSEFWLTGDAFPKSALETTACFQVFTVDSAFRKQRIWAAGYSPRNRQIMFLEALFDSTGRVSFTILKQKKVFIRSPGEKYVFKTIFYPGTQKIKIEVNGVPMKCRVPFNSQKLSMAGFAVWEGAATFNPLKIDGKN